MTLKEFEDAFGKGSLNERNLWERLRSGNLGLTLADFQMVAGRFLAQPSGRRDLCRCVCLLGALSRKAFSRQSTAPWQVGAPPVLKVARQPVCIRKR